MMMVWGHSLVFSCVGSLIRSVELVVNTNDWFTADRYLICAGRSLLYVPVHVVAVFMWSSNGLLTAGAGY